MKNVIQKSNPYNRLLSTKNNLVSISQTPGLSDKLSRLDMEEDECVCSYACIEHQEGDHEQDECVCTITCKGVHTHIQKDMRSKRYMEYALGLKYCPGLEPVLPVYIHKEYKPSTSSGKFTIYQICTPEKLLEGRKETEDVGGGGGEHPGRRGEERREGSRLATMETEVAKLISKWEKRAGGGDCGDSLKLPDMVGGDRGRRVSQEFTELRQRYVDSAEEGGGGRMSDGPRVTFATSFDKIFI